MLTYVWGPSLWHFLHTMSFNYPVKPSCEDKLLYMKFVKSLKVLHYLVDIAPVRKI